MRTSNAQTTVTATARTYPVMQTREIENLIADGKNIIILDQHVLKVDAWMKYHPGGDKAIRHMVGRDATDEVNAYVLPTYGLSGASLVDILSSCF